MEDGDVTPEVQQPVKQAAVETAGADQAQVPNGVHAEEASASVPEPEQEDESSTQTIVETAQPASEPAVESNDMSEQQNDAGARPEAADAAEAPAEEPSQAVPESAPAAAVPREELPIWRRRIWFVRMPKPLEETTSVSSEHELESFKTQVAILNESMNVKRMERDAANELTQAAQDAYNTVRQQYDAKKEEAEPHRARRRELREAVNSLQADFKSEYGDLPAKSEEELNAQLGELQHRITHESVTLNEEKAALARIKKLEASREKVREYGAKAEGVRQARKAAQDASGGSEQLEADVQALFDEMQTQRQIVDNYRTKESAVRAELRGIQEERARIKGLQDEAYGRIVGARNQARDKSRVWGDNRRFSQQIRQVLARGEGALADARAACDSQMDEAHAMLASDSAFRAEYFKLWEGQRKGPTSPYQDMEEVSAQAGGRGRGGRGGADSPAADESSKARAEAVVAAALAQARETLAHQKAKADEAAAAAGRATADKPSAAEADGHSGGDTAAASASAAAAAALGNAPAADKKPARTRKPSSGRVPPPVVVPEVADDPFELPSAAKKSKEAAVDGEAEKERVREQNRSAAAEAAARKERQKKAAEDKRRAAESRRKELAAKEAAAKQQPQPSAQQPQAATSPAAGSPALSEADGAEAPAAGAETASAAAGVASAAAGVASPSGYDSGSGRPKPKGRAVLPQPTPRARMPVKKKHAAVRFLSRSYNRLEAGATAAIDQGGPLVRENPALAVAAVGVLAILVVVLAIRMV